MRAWEGSSCGSWEKRPRREQMAFVYPYRRDEWRGWMFAPDTSWWRSQRANEARENLDSRRIGLIKLGSRRRNEVMADLNLIEPARVDALLGSRCEPNRSDDLVARLVL